MLQPATQDLRADMPTRLLHSAERLRRCLRSTKVALGILALSLMAAQIRFTQPSRLWGSLFCLVYIVLTVLKMDRTAAYLFCTGWTTTVLVALLMNTWRPAETVLLQHQRADSAFALGMSAVQFFVLGWMLGTQPLRRQSLVAMCTLNVALQTATRYAVYLRTGFVASVTWVLASRTLPQPVGLLAAFAAEHAACGVLPTRLPEELEEIAGSIQHEKALSAQAQLEATAFRGKYLSIWRCYRQLVEGGTRISERLRQFRSGASCAAAAGSDKERALRIAECIVCLSDSASFAFLPCGHLCICAGCAVRWREGASAPMQCIVCRQAAHGCQRIYIA